MYIGKCLTICAMLIFVLIPMARGEQAKDGANFRDIVKKSVKLLEDNIDANTRRLEILKQRHCNEVDEAIRGYSKRISSFSARRQFLAGIQVGLLRTKNNIRRTYDEKIETEKQELVAVAENRWRMMYIQSVPEKRGRVLFLYETILDQLAMDRYI